MRHQELCGPDELYRSAIWNEFFRPQNMYGGLNVKIGQAGRSFWFIDIHRGSRHPAFSESDRGVVSLLAPHLHKAVEISRALWHEGGSALSDLAAAGIGGVTVSFDGHVRTIDAVADALLNRPGCGLRMRSGRIWATGAAGERLAHLIRGADIAEAVETVPAGPGKMIVWGDSTIEGAPHVLVSCSPAVAQQALAFPAERGAVLLLRELSTRLPASFAAMLGQTFRLTPKEAAIATHLAEGRTIQTAADTESISRSTARWHLEQIFRKTGAKRQGELVAILRVVEPLVTPS
jgi:DNA-binding CsgD family transcriptional regulator